MQELWCQQRFVEVLCLCTGCSFTCKSCALLLLELLDNVHAMVAELCATYVAKNTSFKISDRKELLHVIYFLYVDLLLSLVSLLSLSTWIFFAQ